MKGHSLFNTIVTNIQNENLRIANLDFLLNRGLSVLRKLYLVYKQVKNFDYTVQRFMCLLMVAKQKQGIYFPANCKVSASYLDSETTNLTSHKPVPKSFAF